LASAITKASNYCTPENSQPLHGDVLAPAPVAPVNATDMVLLPQGLHALKQGAKQVELDLRGAYFNLDGGCDSTTIGRAFSMLA
jgi:hypothetical protein